MKQEVLAWSIISKPTMIAIEVVLERKEGIK